MLQKVLWPIFEYFDQDQTTFAVEHPKKVFPLVLALFSRALRSGAQCGIHPTAVVSPKASIAPSAWIGPLCIIDEGAVIEHFARIADEAKSGCPVSAALAGIEITLEATLA